VSAKRGELPYPYQGQRAPGTNGNKHPNASYGKRERKSGAEWREKGEEQRTHKRISPVFTVKGTIEETEKSR